MDTITHVALGASVGELFFERGFGKKAIVWGIVAQSIPDIDFIAYLWMDVPSAMLAHRGFTHSLLFLLIIVILFSLLAEKFHRPHNIRFVRWFFFFFCAVSIHLFIDAFNNYGIGWLEPFSNHRFSFNTIYVVDPFFSVVPVISALLLIRMHPYHKWRYSISVAGLVLPFIYLLYCAFNKQVAERKIMTFLKESKVKYEAIYLTPAPFQSWLWYVIYNDTDGYNTAYVSVYDKKDTILFKYIRKDSSLRKSVTDMESLQKLIRFSKGYYLISKSNSHIVFNDLRFGQAQGWTNAQSDFVFQYVLDATTDDKMIIQRGRVKGWTAASFSEFIKRIKGQ